MTRSPQSDAWAERLERIRQDYGGDGLVSLIAGGVGGWSGVALKRAGREFVGLCPFHPDKTPSFYVVPEKGFWHCFGCRASGDAIEYVKAALGVEFRAAVEVLTGGRIEAAPRRHARPPTPPKDDSQRRETARSLVVRSRPAAGTLAERYLASRGITWVSPALRWVDRAPHPEAAEPTGAMLAPFKSLEGQVVACHLTFLDASGAKAFGRSSKRIWGPYKSGAIRLTALREVIAIGEGIETTESFAAAAPEIARWCAGSLPNLAGGSDRPMGEHPHRIGVKVPSETYAEAKPGVLLPAGVRVVHLLADGDSDPWVTRALVRRAANRYTAEGRRVRIVWAPQGADMNDLLRHHTQPAGALAAREISGWRLNAEVTQ